MTNDEMQALVTEELKDIPRGEPGQNIYRMAYEQARLNGLGSLAEIPPTALAAKQLALQTVRETYPNFEPMQRQRA